MISVAIFAPLAQAATIQAKIYKIAGATPWNYKLFLNPVNQMAYNKFTLTSVKQKLGVEK